MLPPAVIFEDDEDEPPPGWRYSRSLPPEPVYPVRPYSSRPLDEPYFVRPYEQSREPRPYADRPDARQPRSYDRDGDPSLPRPFWSRPGEHPQGRGPADDVAVPRPPGGVGRADQPALAALPPEVRPEDGDTKELPAHLRRQVVPYRTQHPAGTIVIDSANTYLYYVQGDGQAIRYGIGVGREGFTWSGTERVSKMAEWPDWHPPADMIERQPYLPRFMAGGPGNPLGARALYLGNTLYRIHGTNQPSTIGQFVSSGCIRMLNEDVEDLYRRVQVGTRVVVLPGKPRPATAASGSRAVAR
jgi:lipoprotein-anchoring transpeptidase ErfK/SrfK